LVNLEQFNKNKTVSTDTGSNSGGASKICDSTDDSITGIPMVEMTEELEENIRHRGKAYMTTKNSIMTKLSDEDSDEIANPSLTR
jgi:hypothetical protein